ncbi:unnamed protein product [Amoebophrya sp. A120]|nr:unnamed protein product [Amoebophrya sp. A120]|eukprot:GSA120T00002027001.1
MTINRCTQFGFGSETTGTGEKDERPFIHPPVCSASAMIFATRYNRVEIHRTAFGFVRAQLSSLITGLGLNCYVVHLLRKAHAPHPLKSSASAEGRLVLS